MHRHDRIMHDIRYRSVPRVCTIWCGLDQTVVSEHSIHTDAFYFNENLARLESRLAECKLPTVTALRESHIFYEIFSR